MLKHTDAGSPDPRASFLQKGINVVWCAGLVASVLPAAIWALILGAPSVWIGVVSAVVAALLVAVYAIALIIPRSLTPRAPRVAAGVMGAASIVVAVWYIVVDSAPHEVRSGIDRWFLATGVGLALLLVSCFVFEMARRERARLIESLSTTAMAGVVAWCAGGWVFLTNLMAPGALYFVCSIVVIMLFAFMLHRVISRGTIEMIFSDPDSDVVVEMAADGDSLEVTSQVHKIASSEGVLSVMLAGGLIPLLALVESVIL